MNLIFENFLTNENFTQCTDLNSSGIRRFPPSPLISRMLWVKKFRFYRCIRPKKYLISTGVAHHPINWAGGEYGRNNNIKSIFSHLNDTYLKDLQQHRAMLLLDQSHEGYQTHWLWDYFHADCQHYNINPRAIIYTTGNLLAGNQYIKWADENNINNRLNVIPYAHFEKDVAIISENTKLKSKFAGDIKYKQTRNIKLFNCLNKRARPHRMWFYSLLVQADLIEQGLISMNKFNQRDTFLEGIPLSDDQVSQANQSLPSLIYTENNIEHPDSYYINRIRKDVCLDSWVSVVSEALLADGETTVFLSEKTFKPIAAMHPFIILGNRGSLSKLRELGYKTFDGFIDETYDTLPTVERMNAIIQSLKKIQIIEDKLSWYKSMQDILEHNYRIFVYNTNRKNSAMIAVEDCYKNYFAFSKEPNGGQ